MFLLLAETQELTYNDNTAAVLATDLDVTPPTARNPFRVAGEFPSAVGYYQQRRVLEDHLTYLIPLTFHKRAIRITLVNQAQAKRMTLFALH